MKKPLFAIPALAVAGVAIAAGPSFAGPEADVSADWFETCSVVSASSTKDISNVVYRVDGEDTKIEFTDGTTEVMLPGDATDVWIKSGNNHSGDGSGYGEHFARPDHCDGSIESPPEDNRVPVDDNVAINLD